MKQTIGKFLGVESSLISHKEKLVSGLGGFTAILMILLVTANFTDLTDVVLIVASMGASAVLLFAVPHGQLSQPWPVAGGHLVSALIGVSCVYLIPHPLLAASAAVGLSIIGMYYLKCIHPPGGATALSAVVGGVSIHELGYWYVLTPVMLNVMIILLVAVSFNYLFIWRRYPAYLRVLQLEKQQPKQTSRPVIQHEDFVYALSQIDSFVDITEDELLRIYDLATGKAIAGSIKVEDIQPGHWYSNTASEEDRSVRQVIDIDATNQMVSYKTVFGPERHQTGVISSDAFATWAKNEVCTDGNNWKLVSCKSHSV